MSKIPGIDRLKIQIEIQIEIQKINLWENGGGGLSEILGGILKLFDTILYIILWD